MDNTLLSIIETALGQGIWAALYIYLFFRMLSENEKREKEYQMIIARLSDDIESGIEEIQDRMGQIEQQVSLKVGQEKQNS